MRHIPNVLRPLPSTCANGRRGLGSLLGSGLGGGDKLVAGYHGMLWLGGLVNPRECKASRVKWRGCLGCLRMLVVA